MDYEKLDNVYDYYNRKIKEDGICGTLTAACGIWTACGCFYVIEKEIDINKDNHTENDKNV